MTLRIISSVGELTEEFTGKHSIVYDLCGVGGCLSFGLGLLLVVYFWSYVLKLASSSKVAMSSFVVGCICIVIIGDVGILTMIFLTLHDQVASIRAWNLANVMITLGLLFQSVAVVYVGKTVHNEFKYQVPQFAERVRRVSLISGLCFFLRAIVVAVALEHDLRTPVPFPNYVESLRHAISYCLDASPLVFLLRVMDDIKPAKYVLGINRPSSMCDTDPLVT